MVRLFLFLLIWLCICGCSDERLSHPVEMVFFDGGGEAVEVPASTISGVPADVQVLLWGDRDDYMEQLSGLPKQADEKVAVWGHQVQPNWYLELDKAREWLLDQICLIDAQRAYYTKYIDAGGVAVMGHERVDDVHFYNTREVILIMTSKRPELRERLTPDYQYAIAGSRTGPKRPRRFRMVLWETEFGFPTIPEHPNGFVSAGSCGGLCNASVPSYSNKNIWSDYSVVVHEFAHAIHFAINDFHIPGNPVHVDLNKLDPTFQSRLEAAYARAVESGSVWWEGAYAYTNAREYWAEGVEFWFYAAANPEKRSIASVSPIGDDTSFMEVLLDKDPHLYALLNEWFPLMDLRKWGDRFWE